MNECTYDIQLLDRQRGTWWTWDHDLSKPVANAVEAGARNAGEITRRIIHNSTLDIEE